MYMFNDLILQCNQSLLSLQFNSNADEIYECWHLALILYYEIAN